MGSGLNAGNIGAEIDVIRPTLPAQTHAPIAIHFAFGVSRTVPLSLYRDNVRLQALTGFFRLQNKTFKPTGHKAHKIRVTGYLLWDDEHNGSADVGETIQWVGANQYHHPWRSTAWEIHPVIKVEVVDSDD